MSFAGRLADSPARLVDAVVARPGRALAVWALAIGAMIPGLLALRVDNSPAAFFVDDPEARATFSRFEATFGSSRALRIALDGPGLLEPEALAWIDGLAARAAAIPGVADVLPPLAAARTPLAALADRPASERAERLAGSALDRALGLVSESGRELSLLVTLESESEATAEGAATLRRREVEALDALLVDRPLGVEAWLAGLPTLDLALDEAARHVVTRSLPALVAASLLLLGMLLREARTVAAPIAFVAAAAALLFGAMGYAGVRFDLVVAVLPPVFFSIALATAMHVLLRCRQRLAEVAPSDAREAARQATGATYREKGRALFWTSLSTAAGFGALVPTPVAPIRTLGFWGAIAMLVVGLAAATLLPALLALALRPGRGVRAAPGAPRLERRLAAAGRRLALAAAGHRKAAIAFTLVTAAIAVAGVLRLGAASDALAYFRDDAVVRRAFARAEARGFGLATVELVGRAAPGAFAGASSFDALAALGREARELPGVLSTVSAADLLAAAGEPTPAARAFAGGELASRILPLVRADAAGHAALARLLADDDGAARVTLFVRTGGFETIDPIVAGALAAARRAAPFAEWRVTGALPLLLATQHRLLDTLATSLAFALPFLALVFVVLLRSVPKALAALAPNVWPLLVLLGGMGWAGLDVDLATVMVASIVAGLVVDDTIHTLAPYRALERELGAREAIARRLEASTPAFVFTGLVLAAGFAVCMLSEFLPVARFGALSATAIATALAADLVLVPALFGAGDDRP